MDALIQAVKDVGFPIVCALSGGYGLWLLIGWIGTQCVIPARDRAFKFLDKLEGNMDRMDSNLETQTTTLVAMNAKQASMDSTLKVIADQGCGRPRD